MKELSKKQYLLSGRRLSLPDMTEHALGSLYLYAGEGLSVLPIRTASGTEALLLGRAFLCEERGKTPKETIAAARDDALLGATRFFTGRWVLLTERMLFTDASGLMAAFYTQQDGALLVSSSLALLSEQTGRPLREGVSATGLSWQLLPDTRLSDTSALLSTQMLSLTPALAQPLPLARFEDERALTTEEKCRRIADMLVCAIENMHATSGRRLTLALTGGKDSRLTLAALLSAGVPFSALTAEHGNISRSDKTVPAALAKRFSIPYQYMKRKPYHVEARAAYDRFCAKNSNGADAQFYAHGQLDDIPDDALLIRSGLFEAAQTYARSYTSADREGFVRGMRAYYPALSSDTPQGRAFTRWLLTVEENPISHIDLRDRFYLEQRVGGWAAAIEQSLGLCAWESVQIANCEALLSVLLSATEEERRTLALSFDTIRLLDGRVLAIPVNKVTLADRLLRVKGILRSPVRKLKNFLNKHRARW